MLQRREAILFVILSALFFSLMNLLVRLSGDLPFVQKALFRNLVAGVVAFRLVSHNHIRFRFNRSQAGYLLLRSLIGTVGLVCNYYAVDHMKLADATVLGKLSPFFAILMSFFILKEAVTKTDILIVMVAFGGALFVIKPSFRAELLPALIGVLGGFCAGSAYTYIRKLSQLEVPGPMIVFCFSSVSCMIVFPFTLFSYTPMSTRQLLLLLGAGCAAVLAQFCITAAYAKASAMNLAVFDNFQIVFSALFGFFFLQQTPDGYSFWGYAVIVCAAIFKWIRDRRLELCERARKEEAAQEMDNAAKSSQ